ncbi:hypothetical protein R1flu_012767 [Riccia fluitans]|uniref:Cytochrome P450 n=1 Tax=Riccia fluitans TaxID=41844 RepID=A0ABD1ZBI7_9MARC
MVVIQTEESPHKHSIRVRSPPRKFIRNRAGEHFGIIVLGPPNETWRRCRRLVNMELMNPKRLQQSKEDNGAFDDGEANSGNQRNRKYRKPVFKVALDIAAQSYFGKSYHGHKTSVTDSKTRE